MVSTLSRSSRRSAVVLGVLCGADFLVVADGLIVAVALASIGRDLGLDAATLHWVVNAYVLCFGGLLLLGGRLADLYGRRRVLVAGFTAFAVGGVVAGVAGSAGALVAGRALQGGGAALMAPAALALLVAAFPEGLARDRALGWWSAAGSVGIPAGALLGGIITASLGWRAVLLAAVPVAALAAVLAELVLPESAAPHRRAALDVPGAALATTGLAALIVAIVSTASPGVGAGGVALPLLVGVALLGAFVAVERRVRDPLLPPEVLRVPGRRVASLVGAGLPVGLGAALFVATLHLQSVLGFSPWNTGLAYLALALPVVGGSPAASWLVARAGHRAVAAGGFVLQAAGLLVLARVPAGGAFLPDVAPGFVLVGLGAPIAFVPTTAAAMQDAGEVAGIVSGVFTAAQQVGNAVAVAAMAAVAAARTAALAAHGVASVPALAGGHRAAFVLAAAVAALAAAGALALPEPAGPA